MFGPFGHWFGSKNQKLLSLFNRLCKSTWTTSLQTSTSYSIIKLLLRLSSDVGENMNDFFWKIGFYDDVEKPLFICTKYGGIRDLETFERIFGKIDPSK